MFSIITILGLPILLLISGLFWFQAYTGLSRGKALLALSASVLASAWRILVPVTLHGSGYHHGSADEVFPYFASGAAMVFLTAFALRLWGRWVGEKTTAEERQPGLPGVRAWFCTANVIVGLLVVLTLWYGFDLSPSLIAVAVVAALAAYPLLSMEPAPPATPPVADDLSAEREKILAMLEAGKLTPDESAELLQALRETAPVPTRQIPLTGGQRLILIGAALVALGFFLPWFVFNPGKEMGRMMGQMQSTITSSIGGTVNLPHDMHLPEMQINTPTTSMSGGDIPHGLGWAALAFAVAAALLPYLATTLDTATARTVRLLCLGIGSFIVLYLLTENIRFTGLGLGMAVGGYALEVAGALLEHRATGHAA